MSIIVTHTTVLKVGANKGAPRIWMEGRWLGRVGFKLGSTFEVDPSAVAEPNCSSRSLPIATNGPAFW